MTHSTPTAPGAPDRSGSSRAGRSAQPPISPAARRWAGLWKELDFIRAAPLRRAPAIVADRYGPPVELIPQLFDLHNGRRFITLGIRYDQGPGGLRDAGSLGVGQFLNLAFADWAVADQLWELLQAGDLGVSFNDLNVINGNFDRASKAADQYEKDRWVQAVWELKERLEGVARERTREGLKRISAAIREIPGAATDLLGKGVQVPVALMEPDSAREAQTRFRINQGMYGDHTYFLDMPRDGHVRVHGINPALMVRRASELEADLSARWLSSIRVSLDELVQMTTGREGAMLARAIESAEFARKLNAVVGTFWEMWEDPRFSANAAFEVVTNPERRAAKYMEVMTQRTFRAMLKEAVEGVGLYPYASLDRDNYWSKIQSLREALDRSIHVLGLYARATTVEAFREANGEKEKIIREFREGALRRSRAGG